MNIFTVIKSICKILNGNEFTTGFFLKLKRNENYFYCLMTNAHNINQNLNNNKIFIKQYTKNNLDIIVIEILKKDNINDNYFLLPNLNQNINYINKKIYIVQYLFKR